MTGTDILVGSTLGEYRITRMLGQSQLGEAYLALHMVRRHTAIVITFHMPETMPVWEREQVGLEVGRKGEVLTRLTHPHILPIYACGMQSDYVYLITALAEEASLTQSLKQHTRFSPQQALSILKQLAAGLDYAHSQGIAHGLLNLSNVIVSSDFTMRIAGFGLLPLLDAQRKGPNARKNGALQGQPGYIAPECVLGQPADARSDVYALGVILFELLSGVQPTSGQQSIPSVHTACPEVPEAFDLVLRNMLERDPAQRIQSAGGAAAAFERVVKILDTGKLATPTGTQRSMREAQNTLPPTINWLDGPVTPQKVTAVKTGPLLNTIAPSNRVQTSPNLVPAQADNNPNSLGGMDPFAWWASTSNGQQAASTGRLNNPRPRPRPARQDRRKLITLLSAGTAAGILTAGGIGLVRLMQSAKQSQLQTGSALSPTAGNTTATTSTKPVAQKTIPTAQAHPTKTAQPGATAQPTQGQQPTPTPQAGTTATPQSTPTATMQPTPTPTQAPSHTGTVIGHTSQGTNSAVSFTNPADGRSGLLVHLPNGNWAACEVGCTHEGVPVHYDSGTQKMVCPRHGAIFNPANGFAYQPGSGPGSYSALPNVTIRVNSDGTITTG